ncbi:single-stranded-DNA-specific exonuclease RecJ [Bacillus methanolicus]|uniref:Single-stranded-DNA-specific exonuclease RecJ n=1 Tax=Bacillus methanolicus (strain MGA3 / ATCC 53907) TaxID=796606 RepID=I3EAV4_BACMM|nr:single-stranded-DNA-specific exonuclease RecJ [Bacillus methanolicus]AIE60861.1 Single-stranded-DNA-specific exonuclease RecJ [Bacillus methanolicus MGA3]EIJ83625.1 Single-stranded DNA-specific exonuclease RecJ [Bacillus methanolicus MGA3]
MLKSKTRWVVRQSDRKKAEKLMQELNITPLVASLLVNRGIDTVESARYFLFPKDQSFHDPYLFKDMDKAVERIRLAIERQEPILIYGDYDADGVSSTSVMMMTLRDLGANVDFYIPNRFSEGYGPNEAAFRLAAKRGFKLIITVDTGISALHEANVASELGIDLIITDHHEPGPVLPKALAIIHPKLKDSTYPFRELAGVGVAFKLSHALYGHVPEHFLEIVAIGTIADLVSLKGENRLIAYKGIQQLKATKNIGLQSLLKLSGIEPESIDEETIGFVIAPRLNAAGRLESAEPAVDLLLTDDQDKAEMLAKKIDLLNKERQELVNAITEEAIKEVESYYPPEENQVLVIGKEGWNSGVIGIVASRLVEKFYRPVIVFSFDTEKGLAKGSARSIDGFDLFKNLSACRDILPHFGGHPMAAGMNLHLKDVDELRIRLNDLAKEQLTEEDFIPKTYLDGKIELSDIHLTAIEQMQMLAPYGVDNPKPKVMIENVNIAAIRKIGSDQSHLKITIESNGASLDGIGFGLGHYYEHISPFSKLSVIGELAINEWNNIRKPQVFLQDLAVQSWQLFDFRGLKRFDKLAELVPRENRKWIVFNEENVPKFKGILNDEICLITSCEDAIKMEVDGLNLVLADLPPSKKILEHLLAGKKPARIYAQFYKENSDFFSTMPTRDHFKWFYAFLAKKGTFDLKRHGDDLAKYRGWTKETIEFMSQVFFELKFVTINNGFITLEKNISKRDLSDSKTYQKKLAQFTLENDLLYSSFQQLKGWFDKLFQESVKNEEAMKEWI